MGLHTGGLVPTVHQCLFGYDDGHRMLSSSLPLSRAGSSLLLLLSDLEPGIQLGHVDSYWTGLPVATDKVYALLRTWAAPEMPRPGCV